MANTVNPTSFDNYTAAKAFFPASGVGNFCFPIDLSNSGIPNLSDGDNVTLQFTYSGGDGSLYQVSLPLCTYDECNAQHHVSYSAQT